MISLTFRVPQVSVPVLSKAIRFVFPIFSSASPDLMITPCLVACPMAAMMAVGVASTSAQGQNTTRTVTALTRSCVSTPPIIAISRAAGTSQLAHRSAIRCIGACFSSASCTIRISRCNELSSPTFVARMSIVPKQFTVPPYTSSPAPLSTGRDSPVITDWSIAVSPQRTTPSMGTVSPGKTRRISPCRISPAGIISSFPSLSLLPCVGVRLISFFNPFFALSVVISSRIAPTDIMKATSPAANKSPMATAANMAMVISNAEEILLMPGLWITRHTARYKRGIPQIKTVTQAGSGRPFGRFPRITKLIIRQIPPTTVMGIPAKISLIFLIIVFPLS